MRLRFVVWCIAAALAFPAMAAAQTAAGVAADAASSTVEGATFPLPQVFAPAASGPEAGAPSFWAPFTEIPRDFVRFFSTDTLRVVGAGGIAAAGAHNWDEQGIRSSLRYLEPRQELFTAGNVGGKFLMQLGAGVAFYSAAHFAGSDTLSSVGGDLIRAQVLSQGIVQAGKFATRRARPDGSNNHSLPSGHTASAFATATVLQQHFGWKVGIPAYGFGAYVAASRMSANKHHLSDVILGASIGIAAGRTVTIGSGKARFGMGVAPTDGGAVITFTKQ